jgi:hypothetical protein
MSSSTSSTNITERARRYAQRLVKPVTAAKSIRTKKRTKSTADIQQDVDEVKVVEATARKAQVTEIPTAATQEQKQVEADKVKSASTTELGETKHDDVAESLVVGESMEGKGDFKRNRSGHEESIRTRSDAKRAPAHQVSSPDLVWLIGDFPAHHGFSARSVVQRQHAFRKNAASFKSVQPGQWAHFIEYVGVNRAEHIKMVVRVHLGGRQIWLDCGDRFGIYSWRPSKRKWQTAAEPVDVRLCRQIVFRSTSTPMPLSMVWKLLV